MNICFNLTHVFHSQATEVDNAYVLRSLLDCLVSINLSYLKHHSVPRLYNSGVYYARTTEWEAIPALYARGYGDCKSLACALVAEYLHENIKAIPVFRFNPNKRGGNDFHILVETPKKNGYEKRRFEDPSKVLGMGADEARWFRS